MVTSFRHLLLRHRMLAAWLIAIALLMKLLVPEGFMPMVSGGTITMELCSGYQPQKMAMAMPGMADHAGKKGQSGKAEMPCAFSGLSAPSLTTADPILIAIMIAFVLALGVFVAPLPPIADPLRLRPPLRAPPHTA